MAEDTGFAAPAAGCVRPAQARISSIRPAAKILAGCGTLRVECLANWFAYSNVQLRYSSAVRGAPASTLTIPEVIAPS